MLYVTEFFPSTIPHKKQIEKFQKDHKLVIFYVPHFCLAIKIE